MVAILSKFSILCLSSYFVVYVFKTKLILFYNGVVYCYSRIFLIFLRYTIFIAITSRISLTRCGNTCEGPIYGSNRSV